MTRLLQLFSLLLSLWLLATVSRDVFWGIDPLASRTSYLVICGLLMANLVGLRGCAHDGRDFWRRNWPLLVVSLPLSWVAEWWFEPTHPGVYHALRFLPLVRGFFSMYVIVGWWIAGVRGRMLLTYLFVSACVVYFSSLLFYIYEHGANPAVGDYADAVWWAAMNFTTIGSNIIAVSVPGKVLGVVMGFCGMMMLPVFTAFFVGVMGRERGA
jgi:hypothetical protein